LAQDQSLLLLRLNLQLVDLLLQSSLPFDQVIIYTGRLSQIVQGFLLK